MIDWHKISKEVVENIGDQGRVTQILADAETEVTTFNSRFMDMEKKSQDYEGQISSLQKTNMNLFLRQGNPVPDEKVNTTAAMTYDDLLKDFEGGK